MPNFSATLLNTSRLLLRPLLPCDAPAIFTLRCDAKVNRFTGISPWNSIESAHAYIANDINAMESGEFVRFGLVKRDDASLIGTCTLFHLDAQCRRAEIGYNLLPESWGKGYMQEALRPLIQFGFDELKLNRIEADVDPENFPSIKTLERFGFQREGFLRERWIVNGVKADTVLMGLLLSDWEATVRR